MGEYAEMFIESRDKRGKVECFESEAKQLGDRPKLWKVLLHVPQMETWRIIELFRLEGEVLGIR